VLRHDQGDDIVSEGQAYGMLIAELAGRDDLVSTIWSWTKDHLQDSAQLLASHASGDGQVIDKQPASDADTLAAYALLRYSGSDEDMLHADGKRLAAAVLQHETVQDPEGQPVLVAGPWATEPAVVNPSYWMPSVFDDLARLTGDRAWQQMATATVELTDRATEHGSRLPPDWGRLDRDQVTPSGSGGGQGSPQYGPDAQRVPLWFGAACDDRARHLAAAWWSLLQADDRSSASALSMVGQPVDSAGSTLALLASGATARAAGDESAASDLETGAKQIDDGQPTYYGGAWLALAEGLRDGALGSCTDSDAGS
jgi:endo-1,4-beta-D-glucanase Y